MSSLSVQFSTAVDITNTKMDYCTVLVSTVHLACTARIGRRTCLGAWDWVSNAEFQSESLRHVLRLTAVPASTALQIPSVLDAAESVQTQSLGSVKSFCWHSPAPTLCTTQTTRYYSTHCRCYCVQLTPANLLPGRVKREESVIWLRLFIYCEP